MKFLTKTLCIITLLVPVAPAFAVMQSLNGLTAQDQFFSRVNDTNVTLAISTSSGNTHVFTMGWAGVLQPARGGTGASSFATGSVLFFQNGVFAQDNASLFWDDANDRLGIGTSAPQVRLDVIGDAKFKGVVTIIEGNDLVLRNDAGAGAGQNIQFQNASGNALAQISFEPPDNIIALTASTNRGLAVNATSGNVIISDDIFGFNPPEGTLQVAGIASSTIYLGASINSPSGHRTGCLVLGDSDGVGVTYLTANDGILTATTTKPSICQ